MHSTTRTVIVARTEIRCRATHPRASEEARFRKLIHDAVLSVVPFLAVPTKRVLDREEDVRPGCIPAYCPQCRVYSEWEVVAPETILQERQSA